MNKASSIWVLFRLFLTQCPSFSKQITRVFLLVLHRIVWVVEEMNWKSDILFSNFKLDLIFKIEGEKDVI